MPEGIAEFAHLDMASQEMQAMQQQQPTEQNQDPYGYEGDGRILEPGATEATSMQLGGTVSPTKDKFLGTASEFAMSKNI